MIGLVKAGPDDAPALVEVQTRTFDDDARRFGGRPSGGPPGYDSLDWQLWAMRKAIYYKIVDGERIVGGLILFDMRRRHFNLGRIFIDPDYQDRGIGTRAILLAEQAHPHVNRWSLDTPDWATRNHHFYEKLGYVKVGEEAIAGEPFALWLYEKRIEPLP